MFGSYCEDLKVNIASVQPMCLIYNCKIFSSIVLKFYYHQDFKMKTEGQLQSIAIPPNKFVTVNVTTLRNVSMVCYWI